MESLNITDTAAQKIGSLLKDEKNGAKFRVSVDGGGCNGFQYRFDFDDKVNEDDIQITKGEIEVLIDKTSLGFVGGSTIDYIISLGGEHFEIKNPQASSSCGCGNSFSV